MARTGLATSRRHTRQCIPVACVAVTEYTPDDRRAIGRQKLHKPSTVANWALREYIDLFTASGETALVTKARRELSRRERIGLA